MEEGIQDNGMIICLPDLNPSVPLNDDLNLYNTSPSDRNLSISIGGRWRSSLLSLLLRKLLKPHHGGPGHSDGHGQKIHKGDNNQIISPHTGQPAFTVPMGFTNNNLPAGLQFLGRMYDESTLIRLAYAYEQGTKHRRPPVLK